MKILLILFLYIYIRQRPIQKKQLDLPILYNKRVIFMGDSGLCVNELIFLSIVGIFAHRSFYAIDILILSTMAIIDYKEKIIPNSLSFSLLLFNLPSIFIKGIVEINLILYISGMILIFIMAIFSLSGAGLGFGDVKLLLGILISRGERKFFSIIFIISILIFLRAILFIIKRENLKVEIPLAPYILFSFLLSSF